MGLSSTRFRLTSASSLNVSPHSPFFCSSQSSLYLLSLHPPPYPLIFLSSPSLPLPLFSACLFSHYFPLLHSLSIYITPFFHTLSLFFKTTFTLYIFSISSVTHIITQHTQHCPFPRTVLTYVFFLQSLLLSLPSHAFPPSLYFTAIPPPSSSSTPQPLIIIRKDDNT